MPMRPAGKVKLGDHVKVGGQWRLVHGVGLMGGMAQLEIADGLNSTDMFHRASKADIPHMRPAEWVEHLIARHREDAAGVPTREVGPVERMARGLPPRPGHPH